MQIIGHRFVATDNGSEVRVHLASGKVQPGHCYVLGAGAISMDEDRETFAKLISELHGEKDAPAGLVICMGARDRKIALGGVASMSPKEAESMLTPLVADAGMFGSWWLDTFRQIEQWALFRPGDDIELIIIQDRLDRAPMDWSPNGPKLLADWIEARSRLPALPRTTLCLVGEGDAGSAFSAVGRIDMTMTRADFFDHLHKRRRTMDRSGGECRISVQVRGSAGAASVVLTNDNVTAKSPWRCEVISDDIVQFTRDRDASVPKEEEQAGLLTGLQSFELEFRR